MRVAIGRSWTRKRSAIRAQALARVVVGERDRLVGQVAAREHERHAGVGRQQLVQRRVGQHEPEVRRARARPRRATSASGRRRASTIGRAREVSSASSSASSSTSRRAASTSATSRANGPVLAVLARAQRGDGLLAVGAAGEVVAAEALDGEDLAVEQVLRGGAQRVLDALDGGAVALEQPHLRPADRAGVGLGVEAPVQRILVLGLAGVAHLEARHRRQRPVVGDPLDDREARPAVRAVQKRIAVAAVARDRRARPGSPRTSPSPA